MTLKELGLKALFVVDFFLPPILFEIARKLLSNDVGIMSDSIFCRRGR